jgi:hypothetical protein
MRGLPTWTARCKGGYQFQRQGRGPWRTCQRFASRGEIFCADCATAEVIPAEPGRLSRFLAGFRGLTTAARQEAQA